MPLSFLRARVSKPAASNFWKDQSMATTTRGTVKRTTDKGFGFIATPDGTEYFFHHTACSGVRFEDLSQGQAVTFTVGQGPKGPRAENVKAE
jgi:CspA family cold shock protein